MNNRNRSWVIALIAGSLELMGAGGAQAQEPWQSNFGKFLDEVTPLLTRQPSAQLTAELESRFAGKTVQWSGVFESIALNIPRNAPIVHVGMPVRQLQVFGSARLYDSPSNLDLFPLAPNVADWEKLKAGQTVTFRTTLIAPVMEAISGIRVVTFYFRDLELISPKAPPPVTETLGPAIAPGGVTNGASLLPGIAPASWITIRGTKLATTTRIWTGADFTGSQLPRSLDGVSVKVNGKDALVWFISPTQINALAPDDTAAGPVAVTVTNAQGTSAPSVAQLAREAPGFFPFDPEGRKYAAAVHADGTYVGKSGLFGPSVASRPARPGDRILLFGTGFGPTNPAAPADQLFAGARLVANPERLSIRIGGMPATVEFAGLTGPGAYQFNIVVPNVAAGDQPLVAETQSVTSQASVFLTVTQ